MHEGRSTSEDLSRHPRRREVEGDGEEVLDDDEVRVGQGLVELRSIGRLGFGLSVRIDDPEPGRPFGPTRSSPVTVTTSNPKCSNAAIHVRATTDTPSVGPKRKERNAARGAIPPTRYGARVPSSESPSVPPSSATVPSGGDRSDGELPDSALPDRALPDRALPDRDVMAASARRVLEAHWRRPGLHLPERHDVSLVVALGLVLPLRRLGRARRGRAGGVRARGRAVRSWPRWLRSPPRLSRRLVGTRLVLWGRHGWSSITQPPVYGWTVAELDRRGIDGPGCRHRTGAGRPAFPARRSSS